MPPLPPWWNDFTSALVRSLRASLGGKTAGTRQRPGSRPVPRRSPAPKRTPQRPAPSDDTASPGQIGAAATAEVDPRSIGPVRMTYQPDRDGDPDPGEIVWTWVPYEERDGRGKDRPVLVVAVEETAHSGPVLAVQLTSQDHSGDRDFVAIGTGAWDGRHRPSWVAIDRVFRVHPDGMRREAAALDATNFGRVAAALTKRYGWRQ